jgi:CheY-like chemotaxis protein
MLSLREHPHPRNSLLVGVVDDVPENLQVLSAVLGELNLRLLTASSGSEALEHLLQHEVAVALIVPCIRAVVNHA